MRATSSNALPSRKLCLFRSAFLRFLEERLQVEEGQKKEHTMLIQRNIKIILLERVSTKLTNKKLEVLERGCLHTRKSWLISSHSCKRQ